MILRLLYAFLLQFVDDLMSVSKSVAEHLYHIQKLLKTLAENNVTLNFEKTEFFKRELKFVGFILTPDGIKPDPAKIQFIQICNRQKM